MHSSKVVAQRSASQAQAGSIKSSHSFRRYLHIEAVFVFEAGPEHWSAPSSGQAISDCLRSRKGNPMLNLIYMILVCHAVGYGHPRELMRLVGFPTGKGSNRGRT